MNAELLKKTAAAIRTIEAERQSAVDQLDAIKKEATVSKVVLNMLKDSILGVDEIETKIAELRGNPELLNRTADYFSKTASVGTVKVADMPGGMDAEEAFLAAMQG